MHTPLPSRPPARHSAAPTLTPTIPTPALSSCLVAAQTTTEKCDAETGSGWSACVRVRLERSVYYGTTRYSPHNEHLRAFSYRRDGASRFGKVKVTEELPMPSPDGRPRRVRVSEPCNSRPPLAAAGARAHCMDIDRITGALCAVQIDTTL